MSTHHSAGLLTVPGIVHLVVRGKSGSTNSEMIVPVPSQTSGGVLSAVDTVVQRRVGRRRLHTMMIMKADVQGGTNVRLLVGLIQATPAQPPIAAAAAAATTTNWSHLTPRDRATHVSDCSLPGA